MKNLIIGTTPQWHDPVDPFVLTGARDGLVVLNPDIDQETCAILRALPLNGLRYPGRSLIATAEQPYGKMVLLVAAPVVAANHDPYWAAAFLVPAVLGVVLLWRQGNRRLKQTAYALAGDSHYVHAGWLKKDHQLLLCRAVIAAQSASTSQVVSAGLVDSARVNSEVPRMVWRVADSLHRASKLDRELDREEVDPSSPQRVALKLAMDSILQQVAALETCASELDKADRAYGELLRQERLDTLESEVLDLLARTSVETGEVEHIRELSRQAQIAAQTLERARLNVIAALDVALGGETR